MLGRLALLAVAFLKCLLFESFCLSCYYFQDVEFSTRLVPEIFLLSLVLISLGREPALAELWASLRPTAQCLSPLLALKALEVSYLGGGYESIQVMGLCSPGEAESTLVGQEGCCANPQSALVCAFIYFFDL